MADMERFDGETPNGGSYSIAYYQDTEGQPIDKDEAKLVEIVEYDEAGDVVWRTYGAIG